MRQAAVVILLVLAASGVSAEERRFSAEYFLGTAASVPMPLRISQNGYGDIAFTARYETKPFTDAHYYAVRFGWHSWEFEMVHHKVYLTNPPPEVQHFDISHGYNLFYLNRVLVRRLVMGCEAVVRAGGGFIVGHPETWVRGKRSNGKGGLFDAGYFLAGGTGQAAVQLKRQLTGPFFLSGESKVTASFATVPIVDGEARVPNVAFHFLLGVGIQF